MHARPTPVAFRRAPEKTTHVERHRLAALQRLGQALAVVGMDAPAFCDHLGVALDPTLLGKRAAVRAGRALVLDQHVALDIVFEQHVGNAAQRDAVAFPLHRERDLRLLARRDVHEHAADLHRTVLGLHFATRIEHPRQRTVLAARAVLRLVRRPLGEAARDIGERLRAIGSMHHARRRAAAHLHQLFDGVAEHARQTLVDVGQRVHVVVLAHLEAARDVIGEQIDGGRFLAHELLQVLVGLPPGLEGEVPLVPHRPIGIRRMDMADLELSARIHQLVAAPLALFDHQLRVLARAHIVATYHGATALRDVHQVKLLVENLARRRKRRALRQIRHDLFGAGREFHLARSYPREIVGKALNHLLDARSGVKPAHRVAHERQRFVEQRVHRTPLACLPSESLGGRDGLLTVPLRISFERV